MTRTSIQHDVVVPHLWTNGMRVDRDLAVALAQVVGFEVSDDRVIEAYVDAILASKLSWCGILTALVLRNSGIPTRWAIGFRPIISAPFWRTSASKEELLEFGGYVVQRTPPWHYMLVARCDTDKPGFERARNLIISGNEPGNRVYVRPLNAPLNESKWNMSRIIEKRDDAGEMRSILLSAHIV